MNIGNNIKKYRLAKGLTQEELALQFNKTKATIARWESGENRPDADTIKEICRTLEISPDTLFDWGLTKNDIKNCKPVIIAASSGGLTNEDERTKEILKDKQRLCETIFAANLDKRDIKTLMAMVKSLENL